jgi:hypothetical protein
VDPSVIEGYIKVRQKIGWVLQLLVLMLLPMVIGWQLFFGFRLILMPACVVIAIVFFSVGQVLRNR